MQNIYLYNNYLFLFLCVVGLEMITNELTPAMGFDNLAQDDHEPEDIMRPRSGSEPVVQFADDSDHSDREVQNAGSQIAFSWSPVRIKSQCWQSVGNQ